MKVKEEITPMKIHTFSVRRNFLKSLVMYFSYPSYFLHLIQPPLISLSAVEPGGLLQPLPAAA